MAPPASGGHTVAPQGVEELVAEGAAGGTRGQIGVCADKQEENERPVSRQARGAAESWARIGAIQGLSGAYCRATVPVVARRTS
jgi:hypothetical protein